MKRHSLTRIQVVFVLFLSMLFLNQSIQADDSAVFSISSPDFNFGESIPVEFTCEDMDVSPTLNWKNIPEGTVSFALICDDPDAPMGTWIHWVYYNIPGTSTGIPGNIEKIEKFEDGSMSGQNSWPNLGYNGPCPPKGKPHRYYFRLFALDKMLDLEPGATAKELKKAMKKHIVARTEWMGRFGR